MESEPGNGREKEAYTPQEEPQGQAPSQQSLPPQTDFKVAEIWIKSGQVFLEGTQEFWGDRVRALGLMELCKDIIKTAQMPTEKKPDIAVARGMGPLTFLKNRLSKFKGKK